MAHRHEQFEQIAQLKATYVAAGNPIVSMDTKKKEVIGNFYRAGRLYTTGEIHTYDHDFTSAAAGLVKSWHLRCPAQYRLPPLGHQSRYERVCLRQPTPLVA